MRKLALAALLVALAACGQQQPQNGKLDLLPIAQGDTQLSSSEPGTQATGTYNITLQFTAGTPASVQNALQQAANRWENVVTTGVSDVQANIRTGSCGSNPAFSGRIDDILIFTGTADIDGPGGILAQSGPCFVRGGSGFPYAAVLLFDSADVPSQLTTIATHELGHSIGIGTIWDLKGLLVGAGGSNPVFVGSGAVREWRALGGSGSVPVENMGGPGTRDGHWRESVFGNELMTGFLNTGFNPLSRMTVASISDLGYRVDLNAADPYVLPARAASQTAGVLELNIERLFPKARTQ